MANKTGNMCSLGGDMLAYLYGELSPEGRERFETHLENCGSCIDEFAELSEARYSVYEWKNVEFAPLATPNFVVPSEQASATFAWLDSIKAVFAWNGFPAIASGIAILIIGVFGFVLWFDSPETSVATAVEPPPQLVQTATPLVGLPSNVVETAEVDEPEVRATAPRTTERDTFAVQSQPQSARTKPVWNAKAETVKVRRTTTNRRLDNSPTLGQYVEDRDETLRLSDLFDDLDTKERN